MEEEVRQHDAPSLSRQRGFYYKVMLDSDVMQVYGNGEVVKEEKKVMLFGCSRDIICGNSRLF